MSNEYVNRQSTIENLTSDLRLLTSAERGRPRGLRPAVASRRAVALREGWLREGGSSVASGEGKKSLKKRLHKRQTTHYKSAYEYGTPLYFTRRPSRVCHGKLAAK